MWKFETENSGFHLPIFLLKKTQFYSNSSKWIYSVLEQNSSYAEGTEASVFCFQVCFIISRLMMSPAYDVSSLRWTDCTHATQRNHAGAFPQRLNAARVSFFLSFNFDEVDKWDYTIYNILYRKYSTFYSAFKLQSCYFYYFQIICCQWLLIPQLTHPYSTKVWIKQLLIYTPVKVFLQLFPKTISRNVFTHWGQVWDFHYVEKVLFL